MYERIVHYISTMYTYTFCEVVPPKSNDTTLYSKYLLYAKFIKKVNISFLKLFYGNNFFDWRNLRKLPNKFKISFLNWPPVLLFPFSLLCRLQVWPADYFTLIFLCTMKLQTYLFRRKTIFELCCPFFSWNN